MQRLGGILRAVTDSGEIQATGEWTYNLGGTKRTTKVGTNQVLGFTGEVKIPFIEGTFSDSAATDVAAFQALENATLHLELYNGKTVTLNAAAYTADGDMNAMTGEGQVRFEGLTAQEVVA